MKVPVAIFALCVVACGHAVMPVRVPTTAFAIDASVPPPPAVELESTDGTELELLSLSYTTRVFGPLATTEVRAAFHNPTDHAIEGRFRLMLPPRSSVSRLAMKVDANWQEAEVAELSAARATYEMIMHRKRDPLLVEQLRDREVAARVAPILAGGAREILVGYTSALASAAPIVFPLRGLPSVGMLDVSVVDGVTEPFHQHWENTQPSDDVRVELATSDVIRAGGMTATRVHTPSPAEPFGPVVVLVETSAAHAADAYSSFNLVSEIARLAPAVSLIGYDQTSERVPDVAALAKRGSLGMPILDQAVQNATAEAKRIHARRLVVIGPTATNLPALDLDAFDRVDVLGVNALTDAAVMRPLAKNGVLLEDAEPAAIERALGHRAAEERVVVTHASDGPETPAAFAAIDHVAAVATRDSLLRDPAAKAELIALAKKHRLATPYTAMLVLENQADVEKLHRVEAGEAAEPLAPPPPPPGLRFGGTHITRAPIIRSAYTTVSGRVPPEIIQRVIRQHFGSFRACYEDGLRRNAQLAGRVVVKFVIGLDGSVENAIDNGSEIGDRAVVDCVVKAFAQLSYPEPDNAHVIVVYPLMLGPGDETAELPRPLHLASSHWHPSGRLSPFDDLYGPPPPPPWSDSYAQRRTLQTATPRTPTDYVALGEALAATDRERAARAYGSLAALWPERAELLRAAAVRLDALNAGDPLAIELLRRAVADRPDQPSGHHLLGLVLLRSGDVAGARAAFKAGLERRYALRYAGADDLLRKDLAMLDEHEPLTRVTTAWETDTSDLDIVVENAKGEGTSAAIVASAIDGFGPEAVDPNATATNLAVTLRRRGLGGDVLGVAYVIKRNERGDLAVDPRPFAIMNERATLALGAL